MAKAKPESKLVRACLEFLELKGWYAFRVNNMGVYDPTRKVYRTFSGTPGVADIIAVRFGRFLAVECKTKTGVQSAAQKTFQCNVEANGGVYVLARKVDDLDDGLKEAN